MSKCIFVSLDYSFNSLDLRLAEVSIESKAMGDTVRIWIPASEPVDWEILVCVVVLKNRTDAPDGIQILITLFVPVVQRVWI